MIFLLCQILVYCGAVLYLIFIFSFPHLEFLAFLIADILLPFGDYLKYLFTLNPNWDLVRFGLFVTCCSYVSDFSFSMCPVFSIFVPTFHGWLARWLAGWLAGSSNFACVPSSGVAG